MRPSDEHAVSWKILLPVFPGDRVLAVGLDAGGIIGLARTWEKVDCLAAGAAVFDALTSAPELRERVTLLPGLPPAGAGFDILVLAGGRRGAAAEIGRLASALRPGGTIACLGFAGANVSRRDLTRAGFKVSRRYAALPHRKPRLLVPTASARMVRKGLRFHLPGSRLSRWLTGVTRSLARVGWRYFPRNTTLTIASGGDGCAAPNTLAGWLSDCLCRPVSDLVIYAGCDSPNRRITALACAADGNEDCVVKVADTPLRAEANRREAAALRALRDSPIVKNVPRLIIPEGRWHGYYVQVQSAVGHRATRQMPHLTEAHFAFLSELSRMNRKTLPLSETDAWRALSEGANAARLAASSGPVADAFSVMKSDGFGRRTVVSHMTHGDFVPWNIRGKGKRLFVIDWEQASPAGLALADLFTFLYRQGAYVGPWPGAARLSAALRRSADCLAARAGYPRFDHRATLLACMLLEYLVLPNALLEGLFEFALGTQLE